MIVLKNGIYIYIYEPDFARVSVGFVLLWYRPFKAYEFVTLVICAVSFEDINRESTNFFIS